MARKKDHMKKVKTLIVEDEILVARDLQYDKKWPYKQRGSKSFKYFPHDYRKASFQH